MMVICILIDSIQLILVPDVVIKLQNQPAYVMVVILTYAYLIGRVVG
jgi:hypothetical protein